MHKVYGNLITLTDILTLSNFNKIVFIVNSYTINKIGL
jgi:hypothetical protein